MTQAENLIPEGEYTAQVEACRTVNESGAYYLLVEWRLLGPLPSRGEAPILRQRLPLNTAPGGGIDLAKGHNVFLDLLREAVGESFTPYDAWNPSYLSGRRARILVRIRKLTDGSRINEVQGAVPVGSTQIH